jgi:hypothetical protein
MDLVLLKVAVVAFAVVLWGALLVLVKWGDVRRAHVVQVVFFVVLCVVTAAITVFAGTMLLPQGPAIQVRTPEVLDAAVEVLVHPHTEGEDLVIKESNHRWLHRGVVQRDVAAQYDPIYGTIVVYMKYVEGASLQEVRRLMWHEYGHFLWFRVMTEEDRLRWRAIHQDAVVFPTKYAKMNEREDFSETLAEYKAGRWFLLDNRRYAFVQDFMNMSRLVVY